MNIVIGEGVNEVVASIGLLLVVVACFVSPELRRWHLWFPPNRGGLLYAASRSGAAVFS